MSAGTPKSRPGPGLALAGGLFLVYVVTFGNLADGMILGNDALPYAVELSQGAPHANPHHLLFHPLAQLVHAAFRAVVTVANPLAPAMLAQVVVSALGGALAAACFLASARRLVGPSVSRLVPWALTLLLAFSAGHWLYAAVGETYLPAIAAQTAVLGLALRARLEDRGALTPRGTSLLVAALLLAVLLRQDSVLVVPAVLLLLAPRPALAVVGGAGLAALGLYFATWLAADPGLDFLPWLRGLADTGLWGGGLDLARLQVAGTLGLTALGYPMWYAAQAAATEGLSLERGLLELTLALVPWLLLGLAVLAARAGRGARLEPQGARDRRLALAGLASFLVLRLVFFSWWQPGNLEYHAGNLVPLLLAVALLLRPSRTEPGPARHLVPRLLLLAFAVNLVGNWLTLIEPNRASDLHASASEALERVAPGGLVLGLDRLGHYANLRAVGTCPGERAALPRVLDASDVAAGVDLSSLAQLRAELAAAVERVRAATDGGAGRPAVVATRDLVLPERFEHAPWPLDWSDVATGHVGGMNRLIEGYAALPLDPDAGMASALWELR